MTTTEVQEQTLAAGIRCHDAGDLQAAERHYREVLRVNPRNAKAMYLLDQPGDSAGWTATDVSCAARGVVSCGGQSFRSDRMLSPGA
jgi:hypothetical protein